MAHVGQIVKQVSLLSRIKCLDYFAILGLNTTAHPLGRFEPSSLCTKGLKA